jgi:hypothetical protein
MIPLLQYFEFTYTGWLFWDRSGWIARRLSEIYPGWNYRNQAVDQREFVDTNKSIELFFGIAVAGIQTMSDPNGGFPQMASNFMNVITEGLEVNTLNQFRLRHVLGKYCTDRRQAEELMWRATGPEIRNQLAPLDEGKREWQALQTEFTLHNVACQTRLAILDLALDQTGALTPKGGKTSPYFTSSFDARGLVPVPIAKFDTEAFIKNISDSHLADIDKRLNPSAT